MLNLHVLSHLLVVHLLELVEVSLELGLRLEYCLHFLLDLQLLFDCFLQGEVEFSSHLLGQVRLLDFHKVVQLADF